MPTTPALLNDKALAQLLCISQSWVRKQRWLKRKGLSHVLTIDPIMIGSTPRYRQEDVMYWLERQPNASPRNQ